MPVPKRRKSSSKSRMQKSANMKIKSQIYTYCKNCNKEKRPHFLCKHCGQYNSKQILKKPQS